MVMRVALDLVATDLIPNVYLAFRRSKTKTLYCASMETASVKNPRNTALHQATLVPAAPYHSASEVSKIR